MRRRNQFAITRMDLQVVDRHARQIGRELPPRRPAVDRLILIDEVLTPDSSRFWPADQYQPGHGQPSFDKQFVRDWLIASGWDKNSTPPPLPEEVVTRTREKYIEAYELITGDKFPY